MGLGAHWEGLEGHVEPVDYHVGCNVHLRHVFGQVLWDWNRDCRALSCVRMVGAGLGILKAIVQQRSRRWLLRGRILGQKHDDSSSENDVVVARLRQMRWQSRDGRNGGWAWHLQGWGWGWGLGLDVESLEAEFCADDLGPGGGVPNQIRFRKAPQILQKSWPHQNLHQSMRGHVDMQSPKIHVLCTLPLLPLHTLSFPRIKKERRRDKT